MINQLFFRSKVVSLRLNNELLLQHRTLSDFPLAVAVQPVLFFNPHRIDQLPHKKGSSLEIMNDLTSLGIHYIATGLLTGAETAEQRYRLDTETMSRRLNMSLSLLRTESEFSNLPFSLIIGSHALKCCILSLRRNPRGVEALVCLCDAQTNPTDIEAVCRLRKPVLLVGQADNNSGAAGCISNYEAHAGRKISEWLYRQLVNRDMPEHKESKPNHQ